MSLANTPGLQRIEQAIEENAEELCPEAAVLTGYVLLTEWAGSDGQVYLVESVPDEQGWWRDLGMVTASAHRIKHSAFNPSWRSDDDDD